MKTAYILLLILFGAATAATMVPNLALIFTLYTHGWGTILMYLSIVGFLALICLAPLFLCGFRRPLHWVISAALAIAMFFGPGWMSAHTANQLEIAALGTDMRSEATFADRKGLSIELQRPKHLNSSMPQAFFQGTPCDTYCRRMLHGGQVTWLRIKGPDDKGVTQTITFVKGTGDGCVETLCVTLADTTDDPADVTLTVAENYTGPYDANRHMTGWAQSQGTRRFEARAGDDLLARQTEIHLFVIKDQAVPRPAFHGLTSGGNKGGLSLPRTRDLRNQIDPVAITTDLGIKMAAAPAPSKKRSTLRTALVTGAERQEITSILDKEGPIPAALQQKINNWLSRLRPVPSLSDADVTLIMRLAIEPRMDRDYAIHELFARQPAVRKAMLPWFFDQMENPTTPNPKIVSNISHSMRLTSFEEGQLDPYADRFLDLLRERQYYSPLVMSIGKFSFDPTPILFENYTPTRDKRHQFMEAVCFSDPQWHAALVPFVRHFIKEESTVNRPNDLTDPVKDALHFLTVMGHKNEAVKITQASRWKGKERLLTYSFLSEKARPIRKGKMC